MGTHNQNLVPGSDNTHDLGTTSARWKDLFLRHGAKLYDASGVIFELDYRGLFKDKFCGKATLTPAQTGNPDFVQITLPVYIGMDFIPQLTGPHTGVAVDPYEYDVYPTWHGPSLIVVEPPQSIFQAYVIWHALRRDNGVEHTSSPWNNFNQMVSQLGASAQDLAPVKDCYWAVRWPL